MTEIILKVRKTGKALSTTATRNPAHGHVQIKLDGMTHPTELFWLEKEGVCAFRLSHHNPNLNTLLTNLGFPKVTVDQVVQAKKPEVTITLERPTRAELQQIRDALTQDLLQKPVRFHTDERNSLKGVLGSVLQAHINHVRQGDLKQFWPDNELLERRINTDPELIQASKANPDGEACGLVTPELLKERIEFYLRAQWDAELQAQGMQEATRQAAFEKARTTGQPVLLRRLVVNCDRSVPECSSDILVLEALPNGETQETRIHTH